MFHHACSFSVVTLPNAIVAGFMKCGTTALVSHLSQHEDIYRVTAEEHEELRTLHTKSELHFFNDDARYGKGIKWYARFFEAGADKPVRMEKTPNYLDSQKSIARMHTHIPDAKIIVIMRDPVYRALSEWVHMQQVDAEWSRWARGVPFHEALLLPEAAILLKKGCYFSMLQNLLRLYPRSSVHMCIAERVRAHPERAYNEMFEFLGVRNKTLAHREGIHSRQYDASDHLDQETKVFLRGYYKRENENLFNLLGYRVNEWTGE